MLNQHMKGHSVKSLHQIQKRRSVILPLGFGKLRKVCLPPSCHVCTTSRTSIEIGPLMLLNPFLQDRHPSPHPDANKTRKQPNRSSPTIMFGNQNVPTDSAIKKTWMSRSRTQSLQRKRARGCNLSHPRPTSAGKVEQTSLSAGRARGGGWIPISFGHAGWCCFFTACHMLPHSSASKSTVCCLSRGTSTALALLAWCTTYSSEGSSRSFCHECSGSSFRASSVPSTAAAREGIQPPATRDIWCCLPRPAAGPSCSQVSQLRVDCLASYNRAASAILLTVLLSWATAWMEYSTRWSRLRIHQRNALAPVPSPRCFHDPQRMVALALMTVARCPWPDCCTCQWISIFFNAEATTPHATETGEIRSWWEPTRPSAGLHLKTGPAALPPLGSLTCTERVMSCSSASTKLRASRALPSRSSGHSAMSACWVVGSTAQLEGRTAGIFVGTTNWRTILRLSLPINHNLTGECGWKRALWTTDTPAMSPAREEEVTKKSNVFLPQVGARGTETRPPNQLQPARSNKLLWSEIKVASQQPWATQTGNYLSESL